MRRILVSFLLAREVMGFLPPCLFQQPAAYVPVTMSPRGTSSPSALAALSGGGGEYDLLKGNNNVDRTSDGNLPEFDLLGGKAQKEASVIREDPHDTLLAELIFTTEDVREVIYKRLEDCNSGFADFLEGRISMATDLEERQALRSLVEMIEAVKKAVERQKVEDTMRIREEQLRQLEEEARLAAERAEARKRPTWQEGEVKESSEREEYAQSMGTDVAPSVREDVEASALAMDPKQSYEQLLEAFLGLDFGMEEYVREVVEANYERCTMEFLDLLGERLKNGSTPPGVQSRLMALKGHIEDILRARMSRAAERLQSIVKAGALDEMVDQVYELNQRNEVDEPLILLLETNVQQAERAGAAPAAELFRKLLATAREAIDEKLSMSTRLVRRLLRVADPEKRKEILHDAFRPKASALTAEGAKTGAMPDVPPPDFIEELRQLIKNFGNIETDNFAEKLRTLVEEAEEVSTTIYGKAMSHREQQDYMWQKGSISVFDLEALEGKAQAFGDQMPWQNDAYDNMMPPGFEDGVRTIGGNDKSSF